MSTNNECQFIEIKKGQWYYILERYNAPKNAWDWREHASCYGPFPSLDAAQNHLSNNHANPGSYGISELADGEAEPDLSKDEVLKDLIENAEAPKASRWY